MLRNWRTKGVLQKLLASIPGGTLTNDELQRTVGELRNFEASVDSKVVDDWIVLLRHMLELGFAPADRDYLEVGTGWLPILPVCFSLIGARSIKTYDLYQHLNSRMASRMIRRLRVHLQLIAETAGIPLSDIKSLLSGHLQTHYPIDKVAAALHVPVSDLMGEKAPRVLPANPPAAASPLPVPLPAPAPIASQLRSWMLK